MSKNIYPDEAEHNIRISDKVDIYINSQEENTQEENTHVEYAEMKTSFNKALVFGFSTEDKHILSSILSNSYHLDFINNCSENQLLDILQTTSEETLFLILHLSFLNEHSKYTQKFIEIIKNIPTILVQDIVEENNQEIKHIIDEKLFLKIINSPINVADIFMLSHNFKQRQNVLEAKNKLSKECNLYNELYTQKEKAFSFLQSGLEGIESSTTCAELLENIRFSFEGIMPLHSMHFSIYDEGKNIFNNYLGINTHHSNMLEEWQKTLEEECSKLSTIKATSNAVCVGTYTLLNTDPSYGHILSLPLKLHNKFKGFITMQLTSEPSISRDFANAIKLILSQLAIAVNSILIEEFEAPEAKPIYIPTKNYLVKNILPSISAKQ